jgi:hypothetical protein
MSASSIHVHRLFAMSMEGGFIPYQRLPSPRDSDDDDKWILFAERQMAKS